MDIFTDRKKSSIREIHESIARGDFTVKQFVDSYRKEIEKRNPEIHAYLEVFSDIDEQIARAEKRFLDGTATLLTGIPFAVKDNIVIEGRRASAASKILENFVSPYDATVIKKLKEHDVIFLGRTNMDEFAMGSSNENSAYGITRNPNDISRVPGGSSGGAAAAVAMHGVHVALGSDTGGSVRQPSSFCGCVGLKPTYGAVSRFGLMAMGSSLDQIGPITQSTDDCQIVFEAIRGTDPKDSTSFYPDHVPGEIKKQMTIGVPRALLSQGGIDEEVLKNFNETIEKLKDSGHTIVDVDLPRASQALPVYYIVMFAEVSSNLARYDGVKFGFKETGKNLLEEYLRTRKVGFGKEVRRRILLGTYVLSSGYYDAFYGKATVLRQQIKDDFNAAFLKVDVIMTPTTPTPAFAIGEKSNDPLEMYLADVFTVPANITGHPALSVPSGKTKSGLPLGIQCVAKEYHEHDLFTIGKEIEQ